MCVYIDDLIPGNKYYIIEEWGLLCNKLINKKHFTGIYIRKYYLRYYNYAVFQVIGVLNYLIHINSYNKFYLLALDNKLLQDINLYNKNIPKLTDLCKMRLTTSEIKCVKNVLKMF